MSLAVILVILLKVTVVMTLALIGARLARGTRASVRHVLLAASFSVLLILPIASIALPGMKVAVPISTEQLPAPVADVFEAPRTVSAIGTAVVSGSAPNSTPIPWLAIAIGIWIAGAVAFLIPVIVGLFQVSSLRRTGLPWKDGQPTADRLASSIGIRRRVSILLHESLPGPMTCGVLHPAVILPADAKTWTPEDLSRAVVHELEHVRRADWISQCLARVIAACYWFHPIVWIAWRQLSLEAERACDDAVVRASEATAYADQLVTLAQKLSAAPKVPQLAMANRHDLSTRVLAVLDTRQPRGRAGIACVGAAIAITAVLATGMSSIQLVASQEPSMATAPPGPKPKYDAASIKPCAAEENPTGARGTAGGTNATWSTGRFFVPCVTTEQLIYLAYASYGAPVDQRLANDDFGSASNPVKVRGGPAWVHSLKEKYQIEATAAGANDRTTLMGLMLQSLLEDRFHLKLHRETEEMDMYSLAVAKGGLKLKPMKDGDCDPNGDGYIANGGGTPKCGQLTMLGGEQIKWVFGGFAPGALAGQLTRTLGGVHVKDNTGITDKFVFTFAFLRGEDAFATESNARAALDAIGLTLEKTKGPRGFLAIDSIERPTPDGPFVFVPAPTRATGVGPRR